MGGQLPCVLSQVLLSTWKCPLGLHPPAASLEMRGATLLLVSQARCGGPVESVPALSVDAVPVSIPLSVSLCSHLLCTAASGGPGVLTVVAQQIADRVRDGSYLPIECAFTMANLPDCCPLG